MGLRFPDDAAIVVGFVYRTYDSNRAGWNCTKSLVLNPKALTLLPRHETPRSMEAVEKLVRNLSEQEIVSFAEKRRLRRRLRVEWSLMLDEH